MRPPDYQQDAIKLHRADCMEIMAEYPDNHFDLAIVDPPYGIGCNVSMGRRAGQRKSQYHKFAGGDKEPPMASYFAELRRVSFRQVIWGANHFIDRMQPPRNSPCWIVWDKQFSDQVTFASFEMAWTNFQTTCKRFSHSPIDQDRIHPTQKPVALYAWIYANYAKTGQRIIDTHLGSASNAIAAHYFGVSEFVGCELDPDYFAAACDRVRAETRQLELF